MILVVNTNLLREIDERKLILAYARLIYNDESDLTDEKIKENLIRLLDWDINGDNGLGIYCGKFESIKKRDWIKLINTIKENQDDIISASKPYCKQRRIEDLKIVNNYLETKEEHNKSRFSDSNYEVSGRGKKARPCVYNGKTYKSRQECIYKENIKKSHLYKYLKETNQL